MNAIKEIPTNFRVYYTSMRDAYTQKRLDASQFCKDTEDDVKLLRDRLRKDVNDKRIEYPIDVNKYEEFTSNQYIDGTFLKAAKGVFINKTEQYEAKADNFDLYRLAKMQKEVYDAKQLINLSDKLLSLTISQYCDILKKYYTKVQEELILEGKGYAFSGDTGWICINRCHIIKAAPKIDYQKTKARKAQLLAEGKRLYNKEEAEWCKQNGIDYKAEDGRVYRTEEYVYEIPLLGSRLPHGNKLKFVTTNYIHRNLRGKTSQDLITICNNDPNIICQLDCDIRMKLDMCLSVNKMLYTKFIRNENQKPSTAAKVDRKGRQ